MNSEQYAQVQRAYAEQQAVQARERFNAQQERAREQEATAPVNAMPPPPLPTSLEGKKKLLWGGSQHSTLGTPQPLRTSTSYSGESSCATGGGGGSSCTSEQSTNEATLPSSWKRIPSKSRPGEFSYLHLPTGLKQAKLPDGEPSSDVISAHFAALRKAQAVTATEQPKAAGKRSRDPRPLMQSETTAGWHAFRKAKKTSK
eukprot:CAMPEP_0119379274 /NCGR_PEP_ID=MMETSP1334-20130426/51979_1 /TAXON_ID=127549 /ORGANISM="Calcidiscus leptoporus, Strain RCC1130" /LENGTH=200 /DNA_ID=CAMNT_0007398735 /DNA_START=9 /DNA_END=611 /DNA_ORIENTATION=+